MASGDTLFRFRPRDREILGAQSAPIVPYGADHDALAFDEDVLREAQFGDICWSSFQAAGPGINVKIFWTPETDTNAAHRVRFQVQFEQWAATFSDLDSPGYDFVTAESFTGASGTGIVIESTIAVALDEIDGIVGDDPFRFHFQRDPTHADDNLTGRALVLEIYGYEGPFGGF